MALRQKLLLLGLIWIVLTLIIGLVSYLFYPEWLMAAPLLAIVAAGAAIGLLDNIGGAFGFIDALTPGEKAVESTNSYEGHVQGGGVLAQGEGATAVGEQGIYVGGNVGGSVLSGDFRGAMVTVGKGAAAKRIPFEKPERVAHFTNREADLAQLLADLQPGQVATLCGPGGIGKTALAAEAIWTLAPGTTPPQQFPDGILFHSFYGRPQIDLVLEKIVVAYGDEPKPNPLAAAQRVLGGRQALLLLDGAEEADNLPQLLQLRGSCGVLVTSRSRRDAAASRQDVAPLSIPHAVALLQKWGGKWAAEEAAATAICEQVGGWPLAVRLAGRYLLEAEETAAEYADWLATTPLAALSLGTHQAENAEVLLERSVAQVDETARRLLGLLGQLALQPVAAAGLAAAVALPVSQLKQGWRQLLGYGLLQKRGDGYEATHPLIHTYASRRLEPAAEDFARLVAYYHELARTESQKGLPGYRRLDGERAHIMRLLAGCLAQQEWVMAKRLAWALTDERSFLRLQGYWTELLTALEAGLTAAQQLEDRYDEGAFLSNLGLAYSDLGQVEQAIGFYEQALAIAREIGHRQMEGSSLGNLGLAYRALGQVEKAIGCLEESLAIFVAIKSPNARLVQQWLDELKGKANA